MRVLPQQATAAETAGALLWTGLCSMTSRSETPQPRNRPPPVVVMVVVVALGGGGGGDGDVAEKSFKVNLGEFQGAGHMAIVTIH